MTTTEDVQPRPVFGTRVLVGLGTTTLSVLVSVELLLGLGLLRVAAGPFDVWLRLISAALWAAPFILGALVWRRMIRTSADRSLVLLTGAAVALVILLPYAILGAIWWLQV
jgi:hypothetical protein